MTRLSENSVINLKNKSHSITAQGGRPPGRWQRCDHRPGRRVRRLEPGTSCTTANPRKCHNLVGLQHFYVEAESTVPAGDHQVRMEFDDDDDGPAKGGLVTLYIDGGKVGEGRIQATVPMIYSGDETCDSDSSDSILTVALNTPGAAVPRRITQQLLCGLVAQYLADSFSNGRAGWSRRGQGSSCLVTPTFGRPFSRAE